MLLPQLPEIAAQKLPATSLTTTKNFFKVIPYQQIDFALTSAKISHYLFAYLGRGRSYDGPATFGLGEGSLVLQYTTTRWWWCNCNLKL